MSLSITNIDQSPAVEAPSSLIKGHNAPKPLWAMLAMPNPAAQEKTGERPGQIGLDAPQTMPCRQDVQCLLAILSAAMQVRDGNAQGRRTQAEVSVQAGKEQIGWMRNASNALFASAAVSGALGMFTLTSGTTGMARNLRDASAIKGLEQASHAARYAQPGEVAVASKQQIGANRIEVKHLQNGIDTRNTGLHTLNGVAQSGAAFGTGIAHAMKSLQDARAKEQELEAAVAGNQKELFQRNTDDLPKVIDQVRQLIQEILRNDSQGFRAAGVMA
ncbi:YopD family type III secretion system translocon subunit [Pseudomonas sp. PONIH3]|jgi:hypothetical protein|uniref:YopD family type III secretion system translocon subunit n=1 Tax=Pseudomonas sp. PONIH3 TaxID=1636610 RepID=UPI000CDCDB49|nr:YopD family type III secretion system translocon subunit [Pseudomonas sp. PONIH3]AUY36715.1 hypothetical protein C3F42_27445 [Pseudomonas sp. PONIH3]